MEQPTPNKTVAAFTSWQWLLSSIAWTLGCMGGWLCMTYALIVNQPNVSPRFRTALLFIGLLVAHWLIWQKAVASAWPLKLNKSGPSLLNVVITLWRLLLVPFQLACLVLGLLGVAFACDSSS